LAESEERFEHSRECRRNSGKVSELSGRRWGRRLSAPIPPETICDEGGKDLLHEVVVEQRQRCERMVWNGHRHLYQTSPVVVHADAVRERQLVLGIKAEPSPEEKARSKGDCTQQRSDDQDQGQEVPIGISHHVRQDAAGIDVIEEEQVQSPCEL